MPKLLLYGDYYQDTSGFAKEFRDLIPELLKLGWDVRQVALRYQGLPLKEHPIKLYPTRLAGVSSHWSPEILEHAIKDFEPDIVFSLQDYHITPILASVMSKPRKKKSFWVHYGVLDGEPMQRPWVMGAAWADWNVFHTNFEKEAFQAGVRRFIDPEADLSLRDVLASSLNPKDFYRDDKRREELRKHFKMEDRFVVFCLARNQFRKNLPVLFEAIKKLSKPINNILLFIHAIDTITAEMRPEGYDLHHIVKYLEMEKWVAAVKEASNRPVATSAIRDMYNVADLFVLPSMGEGMGLIFQEALASGVPCIGTNWSATKETLGDGRGLLVDPAAYIWIAGGTKHAVVSSDSLANAIHQMWENPVLRKESVEKGQAWLKELTPEKVAKRLDDIFQKVLTEKPKPLAMGLRR